MERQNMNESQDQTCETCAFARAMAETQWEGVPDPKDYMCTIKEVPPDYGNCNKWKLKDEQGKNLRNWDSFYNTSNVFLSMAPAARAPKGGGGE